MSYISEQIRELREIAEMYDGMDGGELLKEAADTIESLYKKQSANGWIPCSERLPEMCKPVLATYHRECDNFDKVVTAYLEQDGEWKIEFGGSCGFESVIAWQPLPAPYEVKSDE